MAWFKEFISKFRRKGRKSQQDPSIAPDRPSPDGQEAEHGKWNKASQLDSDGEHEAAIEGIDRVKADELVREGDDIHEISLGIQKISVRGSEKNNDVRVDGHRMKFKARGLRKCRGVTRNGVTSDSTDASTNAFIESVDFNDILRTNEDILGNFDKYIPGDRQDDDLHKISCPDKDAVPNHSQRGEENSGFERDLEVDEQPENYFSYNETESGYGSTSASPDLLQARSQSEGLTVTGQASHHCMRQIPCEGDALPNTCQGAWVSHDSLENPLYLSWGSDMPSACSLLTASPYCSSLASQGSFEKIFFQKVEEKMSKDGGGGVRRTPLITTTTFNNKEIITMRLAELIKSSEPNHWYIYELTMYCLKENLVGYLLTETNHCSLLYFAMERNTYPEITWFIAWALAKSWKKKVCGRLSSLEKERYGDEGDTAFHLLARWHIPEKRCCLKVAQALWEIQDLKSTVAMPNNHGQLPHAIASSSNMRFLLEKYYNQVMNGALLIARN